MNREYYQILSQVLVILSLICIVLLAQDCKNVCLLLVSPASYLVHRGIFYSFVFLDIDIIIKYAEWSSIVVLHGHIVVFSSLLYIVLITKIIQKRKCLQN